MFDGGTPLFAHLKTYKVEREKERRRKLNGPVQSGHEFDNFEPSLKKFLETEEGKEKRDAHREEFKTLFDREEESDGEPERDEQEEEDPEPEQDVSKITKREKEKLKKGGKDKVETFNMDDFWTKLVHWKQELFVCLLTWRGFLELMSEETKADVEMAETVEATEAENVEQPPEEPKAKEADLPIEDIDDIEQVTIGHIVANKF